MQDIYPPRQADRVHGAISIARVVFYDLQDACAAEAPERLGIGVLSATLRDVEGVANRVLYIFWKGTEVCPGASNPNHRLDAGRCRHFHIMPKRAYKARSNSVVSGSCHHPASPGWSGRIYQRWNRCNKQAL